MPRLRIFVIGALLPWGFASAETEILWTQYGLANGTLKLSAHTDADPLNPTNATAMLWLKSGDEWQLTAEVQVEPLTSMAAFRIDHWDSTTARDYRVTCDGSVWTGTVRAEPGEEGVLKLMASACINDKWFPYTKAVAQILEQDPDLLFFAGDQLYEGNSGGEIIVAKTEADVPAAMANYLAKWRKFGLTYRELLKDRPSIMVTDDHDVYSDDLWGRGGMRMTGDRTTGGYEMHPVWVNAAERTQMWHLPDAAAPGPWGDGIDGHFTSLTYGGVSFAVLEDRKFKSAPSEVLSEPIHDPTSSVKNDSMEVIMDPAFDARKLDRPDLQLLGEVQEEFVAKWAQNVAREGRLAAVLSQSPFVNVGNYEPHFGDMDSNGWPQTARNRALRAIAPSHAVMIGGDIHYGTLLQHGIDDWGDGPWSYSVPAFASNQNRKWRPSVPAQGGAIEGIEGSGNHHDRFGNKLTLTAKADGLQGYGMILFDKDQHRMTLELYTFDENREPKQIAVPGWPKVIEVPRASDSASLGTGSDREGFVSLFNGKDLTGWTTREARNGDWRVVDGVIDCDPQGEGKGDRNLWTEKEYGDFELWLDWRIKESPFTNSQARIILPDGSFKKDDDGNLISVAAPNTDSGIFLRGQHKSQVNIWCWPVGSGEVWGYRNDPKFSGEVHAAVTPSEKADRPVGEWNTFHIVLKGDRLSVTLNGKEIITNAQLPGVPERGPLALQLHPERKDGQWGASLVQFRNIQIKER